MLLRRFTDFVLRGRLQAMLTAFLIAFIPLIGSFSIVIAAFITLRKGIFEGALVALAAILPYLLGYFISPAVSQTTFVASAVVIVIVSNILTWFFALPLRRYGNWSLTLEIGAILGICFVVAIHLVFPDIQSWWATHLNAYFNKTSSTFEQLSGSPEISKEMQAQMVLQTKRYATGLMTVWVLLNAFMQLVLARWWQAYIFNPGGLREELQQIRLSHILAFIFIGTYLFAMWSNAVSLDVLPILYAIFAVAGLSVIHRFLARKKLGWFWLVVIYIGLFMWIPLSIAIAAFIGLLDSILDFRQKFRKFIV